MNFSDLPVQILVISLERSIDRRKKVENEMQKISIPWEFLSAVDGSKLITPPIEYRAKKVKRLLGHELTPNEIGCYLSHKKAWMRCIEKNITTLVLEDDFVMAPNFEEILATILTKMPQCLFLRLQGLYEVPSTLIETVNGINLVRNKGDAVGATAYLLAPEVAQKLIDSSSYIYEPVDHFLEHHQKHGLELLAIRPYPIDISRVVSTINDRSERMPLIGFPKRVRSIARAWDRLIGADPWFPKG